MASITVQGRFAKTPVAATTKKGKTFAAASLAENSKKHPETGERTATWYDVAAWSPAAIAQMTAVSPKDYVRVIGYGEAKAYKTKKGEPAAIIVINVISVQVIPDTRPATAAAPLAVAAAPASTDNLLNDEVEF